MNNAEDLYINRKVKHLQVGIFLQIDYMDDQLKKFNMSSILFN